jgi:uncharacterized repeat protein (TIGR03803 family)
MKFFAFNQRSHSIEQTVSNMRSLMPMSNRRYKSGLCGWRKVYAAFLLCLAAAVVCPALTFTPLLDFHGSNGDDPEYGSLVQGTDGNFYGTTSFGGANTKGTIFKITPSGKLTSLYSFCAQTNCTDGDFPSTGLLQGSDGNFYGVTYIGGTDANGTVYKVTPAGKLTTLHSFASTDGAHPRSTLIQASNGNFYGTTNIGGANNSGTVFEMTAAGKLTMLYSFCAQTNCADGLYPTAGLVQGTDGNFYGTTGGSDNLGGTIFKITPSGKLTTLYSFCAILDGTCIDLGSNPIPGLVQGSNGDFYGTTYFGGANDFGIAFKITPAGTFTTLHTFAGSDGESPIAGLTQGNDGNFYGTTESGGAYGNGTIFNINSAGVFTSLYSLYCESLDCPDGSTPYGGLTQSTSGIFYGTTFSGHGSVFSFNEGLVAFVETRPVVGKVGAKVTILGNSLTGSTSVTFNGTSATFTVASASEITTTVPAGATTGTVEVETPGGTLKSNVAFRVQ